VSKGDRQTDKLLMSHLKPDSKYCVNKVWALWPSILGIRRGPDMIAFMTAFVVNSLSRHWLYYYFLMAVISSVMNDKEKALPSAFLVEFGNQVISGRALSEVGLYVRLCWHFLFCQPAIGSQLFQEPRESDDNCQDPLSKAFAENLLSANSRQTYFGLRVDGSGKWKDWRVAKKCLDAIIEARLTEFGNFAAFLASFLLRNDRTVLLDVGRICELFVFDPPFLQLLAYRCGECSPVQVDRLTDVPLVFDRISTVFADFSASVRGTILQVVDRLSQLTERIRRSCWTIYGPEIQGVYGSQTRIDDGGSAKRHWE
jgi:hypothetical protein